ncbi:MAG: hypothetical protein ACUVXE_08700 [Anaerolineae bacterium]
MLTDIPHLTGVQVAFFHIGAEEAKDLTGGWLARKRDFQRLVESCHYFINLQHLDMLEPIVLAHIPRKYLAGRRVTALPELA